MGELSFERSGKNAVGGVEKMSNEIRIEYLCQQKRRPAVGSNPRSVLRHFKHPLLFESH